MAKIKVYHLSKTSNRDSIKKYGLIAQSNMAGLIIYGPSIFVSTNTKKLPFNHVGKKRVDLWSFKVDKKDLKKTEFLNEETHFFIDYNIKSDLLTLELIYN